MLHYNNPWLGLAAYEEVNADQFYGRSKEIQDLSYTVFNHLLTVIYGPSGAGKTSILKAGLFRMARQRNFMPVYIRLQHTTPVSYVQQIINLIGEEALRQQVEIETVQEKEFSGLKDSLWLFFHSHEFWNKENFPITPLLVFDQFEEIFTLTETQEQVEAFFKMTDELTGYKVPEDVQNYLGETNEHVIFDMTNRYSLVVTLREDFLARLEDNVMNIPVFHRNRYSLQPMNGSQAMEVITKPQPGLVDETVGLDIIKKISGKNLLVPDLLERVVVETSILSLFCSELFKKLEHAGGNVISRQLVEQSGDDIIEDYYTEAVKHIRPQAVEYLETNLLTKSGFRNTVALEDALESHISREEVNRLQMLRLIKVETKNGTERIEFTHDTLCKVAQKRRDNRIIAKNKEKDLWDHLFYILIGLGSIPLLIAVFHKWNIVGFLSHLRLTFDYRLLAIGLILVFKLFFFLTNLYTVLQISNLYSLLRQKKKKTWICAIVVGGINFLWFYLFYSHLNYYRFGDSQLLFAAFLVLYWGLGILYPGLIFIKSLWNYKHLNNICSWRDILTFKTIRISSSYKLYVDYLTILLMLVFAFSIGWRTDNLNTLIFILPVSLVVLLKLLKVSKFKIHYTREHIGYYIGFTVLLLLFWQSQFLAGYKIWMLYGTLLLMLFLLFKYVRTYAVVGLNKKYRVGVTLGIWLIALVGLPVLCVGYNPFVLTGLARAGDFVSPTYGRGVILVKKSAGHYGVRDRFNLLLPPKFNKIVPLTFPVRFRVQEDSVSYDWNVYEHLEIKNQYSLARVENSERQMEELIWDMEKKPERDRIERVLSRNMNLAAEYYWRTQLSVGLSKLYNTYYLIHYNFRDTSYITSGYRKFSELSLEKKKDYCDHISSLPSDSIHSGVLFLSYGEYYLNILNLYKLYSLNQSLTEKLLYFSQKIHDQNKEYSCYLDLSYYYLFSRNYEKSEESARRALAWRPGNKLPYVNLVISLLFQGRYQEAKDIALTWRDEYYYSEEKTFAQMLIENFSKLESFHVLTDTEKEYMQRMKLELRTYKSRFSDKYVLFKDWDGVRLKNCENGEFLTPLLDRIYEGEVPDSLTVFFSGQRRGFLNVYTAKIEIPAAYERAWIFSEGLGAAVKNGKIGFIDKRGQEVIPFKFEYDDRWINSVDFVFHEGYCTMVDSLGKHGVIDKEGTWIVAPQYEYINNPEKGYRIVKQNGLYGLMDARTLKWVLPIEYRWLEWADDDLLATLESGNRKLIYLK